MDNLIKHSPELFPLFFIGMWVIVSTLLGALSGWYKLMKEFPDAEKESTVLETFSGQSGRLGGISMNRVLTLQVLEGGLRLKMMRH